MLPFAAEGGRDAMLARMEHAAAQLAKKETTEKDRLQRSTRNMDRLREGLPLGGMDRYLAGRLPDRRTVQADYLAGGEHRARLCEGSRVMERAKGCTFEWGEDLKILLEEGVLAGQFAFAHGRARGPDAAAAGQLPAAFVRQPADLALSGPPAAAMLSINARQLPSYGGSLETAAVDIGALSCRGQRRAGALRQRNAARRIFTAFWRSAACVRGSISTDRTLPAAGETVIWPSAR